MKLTTTNEHYARVERELLPGEPFMHGLQRLALEDAIAATANYAEAARLLRYASASAIGEAVRRMREYVVDAKLGNVFDHKRGPNHKRPLSAQAVAAREERTARRLEQRRRISGGRCT